MDNILIESIYPGGHESIHEWSRVVGIVMDKLPIQRRAESIRSGREPPVRDPVSRFITIDSPTPATRDGRVRTRR